MKKLLSICVCVFCLLVGSQLVAQSQGDLRASVGLGLGTNASFGDNAFDSAMGLGLVLGAEYLITDDLSIAPSYEYYFPEKFGDSKYRKSSFNVDGRYYFDQFYGLAGISFASYTGTDGNGDSLTLTETGLNLGGGMNIPINDSMDLNLQAKYNTPLEQLALQAGLSFNF
ncbi:MAG: outer membrane beta-barrel protein [Cyclobacteriaceae bacterium]